MSEELTSFELDLRTAIERHVTEVLGGEIYPAEFLAASCAVAAPAPGGRRIAQVVFTTFGINGPKGEGEPTFRLHGRQTEVAGRMFIAAATAWLDGKGKRGWLYWRRYPSEDHQGGVSIRARFAYIVPSDGVAAREA